MEIIVNIDYLSRMLLKQVVIALNNFSVVVIIFMYYTKKKTQQKTVKAFSFCKYGITTLTNLLHFQE